MLSLLCVATCGVQMNFIQVNCSERQPYTETVSLSESDIVFVLGSASQLPSVGI